MSARDYRPDYRGNRDYQDYDPRRHPNDPYYSYSREDAARARLAERMERNQRAAGNQRGRNASGRGGYGGRPAPSGGGRPPLSFDPSGMGRNVPWLTVGLGIVGALLALFLLFNLVTCIGGAISGAPAESAGSEAASTETPAEGTDASASTSESSSAATDASSGEGVESPWTDSGRFSTGDAELDAYIKKVCDEHSTPGGSFDQNAYNTNIYISRTDYVERENNQSPWGEGWDVEYAKQFFTEGESGNCYNFAAVTEYVLKYFGYADAEAEPCIVKLESDSWGDHGLVFVTNKVNGQRCLVDDALSADGWMLDINAYDYDVRNINQNAQVKGNVDALDDDDEPMRIQPGELTE